MTTCLFIPLTVCAFRELPVYVNTSFLFGLEGWIWELIIPVPDHCPSSYLHVRALVLVACAFNSLSSHSCNPQGLTAITFQYSAPQMP